ncbi:MAG: hypothetical protein JWN44_3593 [Myxococcales bacterium]|nr:hypothetical protein [Myxococcales bacterium]
MTMESVEELLPNGFHDAVLRRLVVDYASELLSIEVDLWVGDMSTERREVYRLGRVTIHGLEFLVIDNPIHGQAPFVGHLTIDGGSGHPSTSAAQLPPLRSGSFLYWLFVNEWNAFIRFAGRSAALEWIGEEVER